MNSTKNFIRSDLARALAAVIGTGLVGTALADDLTLTFTDLNPTTASLPGTCSSVLWTNDANFRMCDPGGALGGGAPLHKDSITGGETWTFSGPGGGLTFASVTGTPPNVGTTPAGTSSFPGSAAPGLGSNPGSIQQIAVFFAQEFNFLAPTVGSAAATEYGVGTYLLSGPPAVGNKVPFVRFPVAEAQWAGTWFPLGSFGGAGVTFVADVSNVQINANTTTFNFEMWANECIDGVSAAGCTPGGGGEDPGAAGFGGWTAQWHMSGTGSYTDTTDPELSSTIPDDGDSVPNNRLQFVGTFNSAMDPMTVTNSFVTIAGETVGAPTTSDNVTFNFPITSLPLGCNPCTVTFNNAGVTDAGGNALAAHPDISFNVSGTDTTAPILTSVNPPNGAVGVATGTSVVLNFNEAMLVATVQTAFSLTEQGVGPVPGLLAASNGNMTFTFTPTGGLVNGAIYDVAVTTAAQDAQGNALAAMSASSFTTEVATSGRPFPQVADDEPGLFAGWGSFDLSSLAALAGLAWLGRRGLKRRE